MRNRHKQLPGMLIIGITIATISLIFVLGSTLLPAEKPTPSPTEWASLPTPSATHNTSPTPTDEDTPIKASPSSTPIIISPQPTQNPCQIRSDWQRYTVNAGDTFSNLAFAARITPEELLRGNCRSSTRLIAGEIIRLPFIPLHPTASMSLTPLPAITLTPGVRPTQSPSDGLCLNPLSVITSPQIGTIISGNQAFFGTAQSDDFFFYKLEIRKEDESTNVDFVTFATSEVPVSDGLLGTLLTEAFSDGEYWIRLVVIDHNFNYLERCSILFTIQN